MVRLVDLLPPPFVPYSDDVNSDDDDSISGGGTEDEDESLDSRELKDLVLVNSVEDSHPEMPESLFRIRGLRRLYAGRWTFEDYSSLHLPSFGASLIEICFLSSDFTSNILGNLIVYCPRLEILSLFDVKLNCLKIESNSLQIMVIWNMMAKHIIIHDTANLERLLFDISKGSRQLCSITLLHTPCLEVLGVLDLSVHTLQIGEDLVEVAKAVSARSVMPSLKILAVAVQFWIDNETMMLPRILECFPCLETLHILFWMSVCSNECLKYNLKTITLDGYDGSDQQGAFLDYIFRNAKVLKTVGIVGKNGTNSNVVKDYLPPLVDKANPETDNSINGVSICAASDIWSTMGRGTTGCGYVLSRAHWCWMDLSINDEDFKKDFSCVVASKAAILATKISTVLGAHHGNLSTLPTHLLSCNDLLSINIGAVAFPDTRGHRSAYMLESLRELELTWVTIATSDINMVLRCCKALERLFVIGHEAGRSSDAATRDVLA
uniref:Uncharacterized protein n=1 Tax=Oryza glumipatula TaxID=40148 RepID=A0A0D9YDU4_9ORYZ